jgi:hypothetical protein
MGGAAAGKDDFGSSQAPGDSLFFGQAIMDPDQFMILGRITAIDQGQMYYTGRQCRYHRIEEPFFIVNNHHELKIKINELRFNRGQGEN